MGDTSRNADATSDVDLMVVGDVTLEGLAEVLPLTAVRLGRPVNPTLIRPADLSRKRVEERDADPEEIHELLAAMARQLAKAGVAGLTPDGQLQHVYSAARLAATVAIRAEVTEDEAHQALGRASVFLDDVRVWLAQRHLHLAL